MLQASFAHLWRNGSPLVPDEPGSQPTHPAVDVIRGKRGRTEFIARELTRAAASGEGEILRIWQGLGPLSLSDDEYPDDEEYSDLLRRERESLLAALDAGCETRVIVTRRPFYGVHLESSDDLPTLLRLHGRCRNLIRVIGSQLSAGSAPRLVMAYSDEPHFSEYCFGESVVIRSITTDAHSGYDQTLVLRGRDDIAQFVERFDDRLRELTGGCVSPDDSDCAIRSTQETVARLRELESELGAMIVSASG